MSKQELQAIVDKGAAPDNAEAPVSDTPKAESPKPAPPPPAAPGAAPDPQMIQVFTLLCTVIANIICRRAGVDSLAAQEAEALGQAAATVAAQYGLNIDDPKTAAWIGLAGVGVGIAYPRVEQWRKTIDAKAESESDAEPEAPPDPEADPPAQAAPDDDDDLPENWPFKKDGTLADATA